MTREEIKAIGKSIADKVFHRKHKEVKIEANITYPKNSIILLYPPLTDSFYNIDFPEEILKDFEPCEYVEITIKSKE